MILADLNLSELKELMQSYGEKSYRAEAIFHELSFGKKISEISNIPKTLKEKLLTSYADVGASIREIYTSTDGTQKFLLLLEDKNIVECVVMKYKYGNTVCISTEVGCAMGCAFCASGIGGLVRRMTAGEILSEVAVINRHLGGNTRAITNIVLMGSGEPFDNYDAVVKFLRLVNDEKGLNISYRNISLSTSGLVDKMYRFIDENIPLTLTVSLHASNNETREKIMPVNKAFPISELVKAAKAYYKKTSRRVIFEYALIRGINDSIDNANELARLLKGFPHHINIIGLNYVKEKPLKPSNKDQTAAFIEELTRLGASVTKRRTMGRDIDSACGQLRRRYLEEQKSSDLPVDDKKSSDEDDGGDE